MNKQEFEAWIGKEINNSDYEIIETVYTFHPCISETKGKEQIADLYTKYGMRIIKDMLNTSWLTKDLEDEGSKIRSRIADLQQQLEANTERRENLKQGR